MAMHKHSTEATTLISEHSLLMPCNVGAVATARARWCRSNSTVPPWIWQRLRCGYEYQMMRTGLACGSICREGCPPLCLGVAPDPVIRRFQCRHQGNYHATV